MATTQTGQPIQWVKRQRIHLVCTMFMVMFLNGFMTGLVTMTVFALRVVKIHEAPMKALSGLFAAVPGATAPGSCGQLFATTSIRASATPTSASASPDRCPTSPSAPSPRKSAPLRPVRLRPLATLAACSLLQHKRPCGILLASVYLPRR